MSFLTYKAKFKIYNIWTLLKNIYVKIAAYALVTLLLLWSVWGSVLIVTDVSNKSSSLANLGSFLGGMFTLIAVIIAIKEYIEIKRINGIKEFRDYINGAKFQELINSVHDDLEFISAIVKENKCFSDEEKRQINSRVRNSDFFYTESIIKMHTLIDDLMFLNKELARKLEPLFYGVSETFELLFDSLLFVTYMSHGKEYEENELIAELKDLSLYSMDQCRFFIVLVDRIEGIRKFKGY